jgi:hypothetical protein
MIWFKRWRRYTKSMDEKKIFQKLIELKQQSGHDWLPLTDTSALTSVDISNPQQPSFMPGTGYPVKAFIDTVTGEVRLFSTQIFQ